MRVLLVLPVAFLLYVLLVGLLAGAGRMLAGPPHPSASKSGIYPSGEEPPSYAAAPGYAPFFAIALFFAVLHIGALMVSSGELSPITGIYLGGLVLTLAAVILG